MNTLSMINRQLAHSRIQIDWTGHDYLVRHCGHSTGGSYPDVNQALGVARNVTRFVGKLDQARLEMLHDGTVYVDCDGETGLCALYLR